MSSEADRLQHSAAGYSPELRIDLAGSSVWQPARSLAKAWRFARAYMRLARLSDETAADLTVERSLLQRACVLAEQGGERKAETGPAGGRRSPPPQKPFLPFEL